MRFLPIAVAFFVACVWLNQGLSLRVTADIAAELEARDGSHLLERVRYPFLFLYRRSSDEELYFNVARAIRGQPYDRARMTQARATAPDSFQRMPEADGRWHRPYAEVPLEYPALVLPFIIGPELLAGGSFERFAALFGALMGVCLLAAVALTLRAQPFRHAPARAREAWWMVFAMLLAQGALSIQRLDAVPALFVALAFWAAVERRASSVGVAMGLAFAAKLVPLLLLPPLLAADARAWRSPRVLFRVAAGLFAATTLGLAPMLFPLSAFADVVRYHARRGLHVESTYGTLLGLYRLVTSTTVPSTFSFGSYNLTGPAADALAALATPLTLAGIALVSVHAFRALPVEGARARADRLASTLLAALSVFWLTAKVFSPQYLTWAIPLVPALSGRRGWRAFACLTLSMVLTQIYLRGFYDYVTDQRALGVLTLVARLVPLTALLVVSLGASDEAADRSLSRAEAAT